MSKIRVLVIDDSAVVRQVLSEALAMDPMIEVVGTAQDPYVARDKIMQLNPDVLTLDVEMPRMDGLTFLEKLMKSRPMPVIMVSTLTEKGAAETLRALELGAIDYVEKPKSDVRELLPKLSAEITAKVRVASKARLAPRAALPTAPQRVASSQNLRIGALDQIVCVGASTGGTEALRTFLTSFPADAPAVVVVQHMPERFTRAFAERLDGICDVRVKEAADGDRCIAGRVLIAPGNYHMKLVRDGAGAVVRINGDPPVNHHRPSVNVMFHSCAEVLGRRAVGVIMTGMGDDGAEGLLAMRRAGARTIAQDEATSVVFGMPRVAIEKGAAEHIVPLDRMARVTLDLVAGNLAASGQTTSNVPHKA